ncbi:MAG: penicillin-binding protein 2 [Candidatus Kerfeldbacteria bacterium]|nr:penicillin-binding protein 2 [Candidatus Kerfeldbacteria bacterium]
MRRRGRRPPFPPDRISVLIGFFAVFAVVVVLRLVQLQVFQHGHYEALAIDQHQIAGELLPTRGEIYVRDRFSGGTLFPLATNRTYHLLYAVPKDVENPQVTARSLAPLLDADEATIFDRLNKPGDIYEPLQHGMTDEQQSAVEALGLKGIAFQDEELRYYPEGTIGSHVLGFVGYVGDERKGRYGIEEEFDAALAGKPGSVITERDAAGREIPIADRVLERPEHGADIVLTIDRTIQYEACGKLDAWVKTHGAASGSLIILDPKTGAVLASCGAPDFDPNHYGDVADINTFANPVVFAAYEPGSVFKPITMAAALDLGRVTPQTTYEDTGAVEIGKFTIKNSDLKSYGVQTMAAVLEKSLNTGAIFAGREVGDQAFLEYVKAFGFGLQTDVELPGEHAGNLSTIELQREIYTATASYGQGITVTPIQLAAAYGAIANGGKLMKPYLVESLIPAGGERLDTQPTVVRQVISPRTASTLSAMLVNVVENGHGWRAGVPGYFVGGKTGTAQIPAKDKRGYEPDAAIGSFAGFAPASNPKFVMVVRVDRPKDVQFAENSAAPLFGQIAEFLLHYLEVPPTRTTSD